ncbi:MAG: MCP four helix bundle domain-containing protein, partial [Bryobacterales bacterium]|nr:MCP four helix bundle domain-containing protein [Bryobacterales bacterium]
MQWFRDRLTATKLLLGFGLVIAMLIAVAAAGVQGMQRIDSAMTVLYETHALGMNAVKDANVYLIKGSRAVRNAILDDNEADIRQRMSDLVRFREGFATNIAAYEKNITIAANREKTAALRRRFEELNPKQDRVVAMALAGKDAEAKAGLKDIRAIADQIEAALDEQEAAKLELMQKSAAEAKQTYEAARVAMLATTVGALVLALVLALSLGRIISNPLKEAAAVLGRVAEGDFTVHLDTHSKDEVGQMAASLNRAVEDLRSALTEIRSRSGEVSE